jgi:hypothetical protein
LSGFRALASARWQKNARPDVPPPTGADFRGAFTRALGDLRKPSRRESRVTLDAVVIGDGRVFDAVDNEPIFSFFDASLVPPPIDNLLAR